MTQPDPIRQLLAACIPINPQPWYAKKIQTAADHINDWSKVPDVAEKHGMAPLLYFHISAGGIHVPDETLRCLKAQLLRERLIHREQEKSILELNTFFINNGIEILFLKGAALAYLLYPRPELRPMSDLDFLVSLENIKKTCSLLGEMGYQGFPELPDMKTKRHLPFFYKPQNGFTVYVEPHYMLFQDKSSKPWFGIRDLSIPYLAFQVGENNQVHCLGHEDMLFHLCQHAFFDNQGLSAYRFIWVADIVNYAEKYVQEIDWERIRRIYPSVIHTLVMLNFITPITQIVLEKLKIATPIGSCGDCNDFSGWPVLPIATWKKEGLGRFLKDTFFPSDWWLKMHYGIRTRAPLWYYWFLHIFVLLEEFLRRCNVRHKKKHP